MRGSGLPKERVEGLLDKLRAAHHGSFVPVLDEAKDRFVREAVYGGRTEAFERLFEPHYKGRRFRKRGEAAWRECAGGRELGKLLEEGAAEFEPGGAVEVFEWRSEPDGENHKAASISERVRLSIEAPRNARAVRFVFELGEADNDWFWAIDDIRVYAAPDRSSDDPGR